MGNEFGAAAITAFAVFAAVCFAFAWVRSAMARRQQLKEAQGAMEAENIGKKKVEAELFAITRELKEIRSRFKDVLDLDAEARNVAGQIDASKQRLASLEAFCRTQSEKRDQLNAKFRAAYEKSRGVIEQLQKEIAVAQNRYSFIELGVYEPHFDFTDSEDYKKAIVRVRDQQNLMIQGKQAVTCPGTWSLNGSEAQGRTMIERSIRLTLRAFNNECEAAIANTRWNNATAMERRIKKAREHIDKLNTSNQVAIAEEYLNLKLQELRLTHEYREKRKAEREQRAEAARRDREEQKLLRDLENAQKEEEHYQRLLDKARLEAASISGSQLDAFKEQIEMLERDLAEAHKRTERAQAMAERTRCGYIYIISNIGSFGEGVVKIGLTRRLDPMDRVRELGDASVPFTFDTHAIIYSEDAPELERKLHREFEASRINTQNFRKEFFRAPLDAVEQAVRRLAPDAPFFKDIEAQEYRETLVKRQLSLSAPEVPTPEHGGWSYDNMNEPVVAAV